MTEHITSGCDAGIPRPVDTPQEGVRSVRVRPTRIERLLAVYVARHRVVEAFDGRTNLSDEELQELARMAQGLADMAAWAWGD